MEKLNSEFISRIEDLVSISNAIKDQNKKYQMSIENIDLALNDLRFKLLSSQLEFNLKISYFRERTLELLEYIDSYEKKNINISKIEEIKQVEFPKCENEELKKQLEPKDNQLNKLKKDLNNESADFSFILDNCSDNVRFLTKFDKTNDSKPKEKIITEIEKYKNTIKNQDLDSVENEIELSKINESEQRILNLKMLLKNSAFQLKKELIKTKNFFMTLNEEIKLREKLRGSYIEKLAKPCESISIVSSNDHCFKVKTELKKIEKKNFAKKHAVKKLSKNIFDLFETIIKVKQFKHKKKKSNCLSRIKLNANLPEKDKALVQTTSFLKSESNKLTGFPFDPFKKQFIFFGSYPDTIFRFVGIKKRIKRNIKDYKFYRKLAKKNLDKFSNFN